MELSLRSKHFILQKPHVEKKTTTLFSSFKIILNKISASVVLPWVLLRKLNILNILNNNIVYTHTSQFIKFKKDISSKYI